MWPGAPAGVECSDSSHWGGVVEVDIAPNLGRCPKNGDRFAYPHHRLVQIEDGRVTFNLKNYAKGNRREQLSLTAGEFIRRFLLHVLPRRFVRIRHYGLLAARNVHTRLAEARARLERNTQKRRVQAETTTGDPKTWWQRLLQLTGVDVMLCPYCDGRMIRLGAELPPRSPP